MQFRTLIKTFKTILYFILNGSNQLNVIFTLKHFKNQRETLLFNVDEILINYNSLNKNSIFIQT